jgi:hypothetical protein
MNSFHCHDEPDESASWKSLQKALREARENKKALRKNRTGRCSLAGAGVQICSGCQKSVFRASNASRNSTEALGRVNGTGTVWNRDGTGLMRLFR